MSDNRATAGSDFSAISQGIVLPTSNALLYSRFGGTEAASLRNLANESAPLVEVGDMVENANYITLDSNGNRLSSASFETASMTIMAVVRAPVATGTSRIVSCNSGSGSRGLTFYLTSSTMVMAATFDDATTSLVNCTLAIPDNDAWIIAVGEVEAGVGLRVKDETRNLSAAVAKTTARTTALNTTYTLQIGSRPGAAQTGGEIDMSSCLIIPGILSATDRAAWIGRMRSWAARRPVPIIV